ncbi:MAG: helix-turn-helix domain-containing protein [Balneolaceae bacterium]
MKAAVVEKYDNMNLGEKLSTKRKNRGYSQELLAEHSGISLRTIQRIENNLVTPRPYTLKAIADALEIDLEELCIEHNIYSDDILNESYLSKISLINSSAFAGILIPFFNILLPVILWKFNHNNPLINEKGKRIISFQILWTLLTLIIVVLSHLAHYKIMGEFVVGRIPFALLVYVLLLFGNIFVIIKNAIQLKNKQTNIYSFIPIIF